mmetsp:Transcript_2650/g.8243  ORF Transcript_2650/g.8243 Transcript_2650/m.8243 type:complete len:209 (-) Transcript_2650:1728-2354(-)
MSAARPTKHTPTLTAAAAPAVGPSTMRDALSAAAASSPTAHTTSVTTNATKKPSASSPLDAVPPLTSMTEPARSPGACCDGQPLASSNAPVALISRCDPEATPSVAAAMRNVNVVVLVPPDCSSRRELLAAAAVVATLTTLVAGVPAGAMASPLPIQSLHDGTAPVAQMTMCPDICSAARPMAMKRPGPAAVSSVNSTTSPLLPSEAA